MFATLNPYSYQKHAHVDKLHMNVTVLIPEHERALYSASVDMSTQLINLAHTVRVISRLASARSKREQRAPRVTALNISHLASLRVAEVASVCSLTCALLPPLPTLARH